MPRNGLLISTFPKYAPGKSPMQTGSVAGARRHSNRFPSSITSRCESSAPDLAGLMGMKQAAGRQERALRPSLEMDLVSDIGDNKAIGGGYVGAIPASSATQMFHASTTQRQNQERKEEQERFSRLMMAKMNSLEEGFRDVIHEMRDAVGGSKGSRNQSPQRVPKAAPREKRSKEKEKEERQSPVVGTENAGDKENMSPQTGEEQLPRGEDSDKRDGGEAVDPFRGETRSV